MSHERYRSGIFFGFNLPFCFRFNNDASSKDMKILPSLREYPLLLLCEGEGRWKKNCTVVRKWLHVVPNWQKFFGDHCFCTSVFVYGIGFSNYGTAGTSAIFTTIHVFSFVLLKKEFRACLSMERHIYLLKNSVNIMEIFY